MNGYLRTTDGRQNERTGGGRPSWRGGWMTRTAIGLLLFATGGVFLARAAENEPNPPKLSPLQLLTGKTNADDDNPVTLAARIEATQGGPDGTLFVTAKVASGWHLYSVTQKPGATMPTKMKLLAQPEVTLNGKFTPNRPPVEKKLPEFDTPVEEHDGTVVWSAPVRLPLNVDLATFEVKVKFTGQVCKEACMPINKTLVAELVGFNALKFSPSATPEPGGSAATSPGQTPDGSPGGAANVPGGVEPAAAPKLLGGVDLAKLEVASEEEAPRPLYSAIWWAFVGGFVLNFMPCVLPVIGLKVMSFLQQAGHSRRKAFMLNVWYSLGLLAVFLGLATLAVVFSFGWGQQNQYGAFNITMAAIVFAMGLSFLGVWEIPIPGFVGHGKAADMAEQEGPLGAFLKGIITTILAVPCSGPGIATALAWCTGKPAPVVYGVFCCMALGMAMPYLVLGANPSLAKFIPKPGLWMETFKEVMGFVLLGTVVFILSYLAWPDVLPTIALLFGIWAACWWIGRTSITAPLPARVRSWAIAMIWVALIALFSFTRFRAIMDERFQTAAESVRQRVSKNSQKIDWQPFSVARLQELTAQGKTVLVDFTADWCVTCKTLEATVLKTQQIQLALRENQVVTLVADWTEQDDEITQMLDLLGSKQVPVLAIFPAKSPNRPHVLRGWYTATSLQEKIDAAGPSLQRLADVDSRPAR